MAVDHYENFPVASIVLPARLRPAVRALYAFARGADDLADEGDAPPAQRRAVLQAWRAALQDIGCQRDVPATLAPGHQLVFTRLARIIAAHHLPIQPLLDLLSAFIQDLDTPYYPDEAALMDYCQRSANPVGRLMLHLFGATGAQDLAQSDAICSGLQRVNFCQDVAIDQAKGRCYIPLDCLARHEQTLQSLGDLCAQAPQTVPAAWQAILREQAGQARHLLLTGSPLAWRLPGRIGFELRLVVHGGLRILDKLAAGGYNPYANRPILGPRDRFLLCWRAIGPAPAAPASPSHHDS
ncbi:squalene synthase HpnC [Castellaniella caeni]|uniref:squalene synthase HpnC n=1 Tax=Castellaniella caeni TaxID=266123 RepID=UPI0008376E35|nr:squalene synthase HpnC [Castellaniella caeni]